MRNLNPTKIEHQIDTLVDSVYEALVIQYNYWFKNCDNLDCYPNFEAVCQGFNNLRIDVKLNNITNAFEVIYCEKTVGFIKRVSDRLDIEQDVYKPFMERNILITESIWLRKFLFDICDLNEKQIYNLERILFAFQA